ncbi:glutamic acid-rich protein-like isoform X1 [Zingiber officinale]|uniref:glutamic acid-rich protein-like isoform X1 n=2 Tax=Zingiber officinale TaxID=94328 RepID=UPI001C4CDF8F|nr:glutamic acid-rich protein-like isoform X1 [Zingiber officinale]
MDINRLLPFSLPPSLSTSSLAARAALSSSSIVESPGPRALPLPTPFCKLFSIWHFRPSPAGRIMAVQAQAAAEAALLRSLNCNSTVPVAELLAAARFLLTDLVNKMPEVQLGKKSEYLEEDGDRDSDGDGKGDKDGDSEGGGEEHSEEDNVGRENPNDANSNEAAGGDEDDDGGKPDGEDENEGEEPEDQDPNDNNEQDDDDDDDDDSGNAEDEGEEEEEDDEEEVEDIIQPPKKRKK